MIDKLACVGRGKGTEKVVSKQTVRVWIVTSAGERFLELEFMCRKGYLRKTYAGADPEHE
jgi:hypothetical protein